MSDPTTRTVPVYEGPLPEPPAQSTSLQHHREHCQGWDFYLPRLASYAPMVAVMS